MDEFFWVALRARNLMRFALEITAFGGVRKYKGNSQKYGGNFN